LLRLVMSLSSQAGFLQHSILLMPPRENTATLCLVWAVSLMPNRSSPSHARRAVRWMVDESLEATRHLLRTASLSPGTVMAYRGAVRHWQNYCNNRSPHTHHPMSHRSGPAELDDCVSFYWLFFTNNVEVVVVSWESAPSSVYIWSIRAFEDVWLRASKCCKAGLAFDHRCHILL
jgi:hypothetical protein